MTTSVWFLRGMLGDAEGNMEFAYQRDARLLSYVEQVPQLRNVREHIGGAFQDFYRMAYIEDADARYVVGIPTISEQFSARTILEKNGWSTRRFLWIIAGTKNINGSIQRERVPSVWLGMRAHMLVFIRKNIPVSPLFIAHSSSAVGIFDQGFSLYGEMLSSEKIHIAASYGEDRLHFQERAPFQIRSTNGLYISIQSDILKKISEKLIGSVDSTLAELLHFSKTRPQMLSSLSRSTRFGVFIDGSDIAIGVASQDQDFKSLVASWAGAEQGTRHPQRRAFALPDKTLGYEYIPSSPTVLFEQKEHSGACEVASSYDEQLFVCKNEDAEAVSNSHSFGAEFLQQFSGASGVWSGAVGRAFIEKIFPNFSASAISFQGDEFGGSFVVEFK